MGNTEHYEWLEKLKRFLDLNRKQQFVFSTLPMELRKQSHLIFAKNNGFLSNLDLGPISPMIFELNLPEVDKLLIDNRRFRRPPQNKTP